MAIRKASAVWNGGLRGGKGSFQLASGLTANYNFGSRFENGEGSNPEELLAAAEAACFSMALSGALEKAGAPATKIKTDAECHIEKVGDAQTVTRIVLNTRVIANIDKAAFDKIAEDTRVNCPVSRALKAVDIQLQAQLATA